MPFRILKTRYGAAVAFCGLALAGGYAINENANSAAQKLYQGQIATCHRANTARAESNRRIHSHRADTEVLRQFLTAARRARLASYRRSHQRADLTAADSYSKLVGMLDTQVKFRVNPLVNCEHVIKKP